MSSEFLIIGMVQAKHLARGVSGFVPYALMERIKEEGLPKRRQSGIIANSENMRAAGYEINGSGSHRKVRSPPQSPPPGTDRLSFRLEEARSIQGSRAGTSNSPADNSMRENLVDAANGDSTTGIPPRIFSRSSIQQNISYHGRSSSSK